MMWLRNKLFGTRWVILGPDVMKVHKIYGTWVGFEFPCSRAFPWRLSEDGTAIDSFGHKTHWYPYYGW